MKKRMNLTFFFSFIVFIIMFCTVFSIFSIMILLNHFGIMKQHNPVNILFIFAIMSIIVGTVFSKIISKNVLKSFLKISEAAQEVAKENFNVTLDENIPVEEIRSTAIHFNQMTKELSQTEIFRSDFINNVSHEFKTPLSAIEGYATLIQNKHLSEEKKDMYINKIIFNTQRLTKLTGNILELSHLENNDLENKYSKFSLDEQIREILLLFEEDWTKKNIEIDVDLEEIDYYGNKELLSHAWQNLISNAIKFTPTNGKITLRANQNNKQITVKIMDTGIGISEEELPRIFEKFYQGETSHSFEGNGLGLSLVKKIISLHGGEIYVTSQKNIGSTFQITL